MSKATATSPKTVAASRVSSSKKIARPAAPSAPGAHLTVEDWAVDKPVAYARNARKIPQSAVDKVAASIKEFGWRQPIVVDTEGVIVVGHTRLQAAQKLGLHTVPVHVARDLTATQIRAYRLTDNRVHEEAEWQDDLLAIELEELKLENYDLELTGFDFTEINKLLPNADVASDAEGPASIQPSARLVQH